MSLQVLMLSYPVTEQAGGPGVAASGFARHLAALGASVHLVASDYGERASWLVDDQSAREAGYRLTRLHPAGFAGSLARFLRALRLPSNHRSTVAWVNGIWGAQSLAGGALGLRGVPYVVRPAGSLGIAALGYRALKKRLYYQAVETHILHRARRIHCMSPKEVAELPAELRSRAFIIPSGVDIELTAMPGAARDDLVGVLARLHSIKRHHAVLDAVERLAAEGRSLKVEFVGSDSGHESELRARISQSEVLRKSVQLLGHIEPSRLPAIVGRWRAAFLLSEQENFGHAVLVAAAAGVPSIVSPGVGLGWALSDAKAGVVVAPGRAVEGLRTILSTPPTIWFEHCQRFAGQYAWPTCARALLSVLEQTADAPRAASHINSAQ